MAAQTLSTAPIPHASSQSSPSPNPSSESDITRRTKKKFKRGRGVSEEEVSDEENQMDTGISLGNNGLDKEKMMKSSYRDMLTGDRPAIPGKWDDWSKDNCEEEMFFDECMSDDEEPSDGQIPRVCFSREEKAQMRRPWLKTIIVKLLGKVLGYQTLSTRIKQLWQLTGRFKLVDLGHDYFLFKFEKKEDYLKVLEGGPWIIGGHYLTVRQWTPNFNPAKDEISKVIAWIRFPGLPLEYYSPIALHRMGACVGRVIKIDRNTEESLRGKFARMCVEIDLTKPLVSMIHIGKHIQLVEFEGLHLICFHCGKFGHRLDSCPLVVKAPECPNDETTKEDVQENANRSGTNFGPWMLVSRRNRQPTRREDTGKGKLDDQSDSRRFQGNRFANLETEEAKESFKDNISGKVVNGIKGKSVKSTMTKGSGKSKDSWNIAQKRKDKNVQSDVIGGASIFQQKAINEVKEGSKQFVFQAGSSSNGTVTGLDSGSLLAKNKTVGLQDQAKLVLAPLGSNPKPINLDSSPLTLPQPNPPSRISLLDEMITNPAANDGNVDEKVAHNEDDVLVHHDVVTPNHMDIL